MKNKKANSPYISPYAMHPSRSKRWKTTTREMSSVGSQAQPIDPVVTPHCIHTITTPLKCALILTMHSSDALRLLDFQLPGCLGEPRGPAPFPRVAFHETLHIVQRRKYASDSYLFLYCQQRLYGAKRCGRRWKGTALFFYSFRFSPFFCFL